MTRYRLTRPEYYEPGVPGHLNLGLRQGFFVDAETPAEAVAQQARQLPHTDTWDVQTGGDGPWAAKPATRYRRHGDEWRPDT